MKLIWISELGTDCIQERERESLIGLTTGAVPFYIYSEPPYRKDVGLKIDFGSVIGAVK